MGQIASLYRVSSDNFKILENANGRVPDLMSLTKDSYLFQQTFMGLEFVLAKGQDERDTELLREIFIPYQYLGGTDHEAIEHLSLEEQFEAFEEDESISFIPPEKISIINQILNSISEALFMTNFDPDELNRNGIYPSVWHRNNSPDEGFNERHIINDFKNLKKIFAESSRDKDFIIVYVGY